VEYVDEVSGEVKEARALQEVVKLDRNPYRNGGFPTGFV
jgi:hypothetical protein